MVIVINTSAHSTTAGTGGITVSVTGKHTISDNWRYIADTRHLKWGDAGANDVTLRLTEAAGNELLKHIAIVGQTGFLELY